jgi:hypothetical protein
MAFVLAKYPKLSNLIEHCIRHENAGKALQIFWKRILPPCSELENIPSFLTLSVVGTSDPFNESLSNFLLQRLVILLGIWEVLQSAS